MNIIQSKYGMGIIGVLLFLLFLPAVTLGADYESHILPLRLGGSEVLQLEQISYKMKVITSDEDIVHARPLKEDKVYIRGKKLGYCTVTVWDTTEQRVIAKIDVTVTYDLTGLKQQLAKHFPNQAIEVYGSETGIVLSGTVTGPEVVEQVLRLSERFLPRLAGGAQGDSNSGQSGTSITNLMKVGGPQQVMLEVKFAEVTRRSARDLQAGFSLGGLSSEFGGGIGVNPLAAAAPLGSLLVNLAENPANVIIDIGNFSLYLNFLEQENLSRILAEPRLVTQSGQEASFLAGGEYPYPVDGGDNNGTTIEFKEFGVGLRFSPIVRSDGMITLRVAPSVSDIVDLIPTAVGAQPVLSIRQLESTVNVRDGQTIVLAGLLQENLSEVIEKVPVLGDIPVLGALFRSSNYQNDKTDLLVAVTPHIIQPVREGEISYPGEFVKAPNRFEFYLEGKLEGRRSPNDPSVIKPHSFNVMPQSSGGLEGDFGHTENKM
jgi:pilus assembly protein CpaC